MTSRFTPARALDALRRAPVVLDLDPTQMDEIVTALVRELVRNDLLSDDGSIEAIDRVLQREREGASTIGNAAAIPHARLDTLEAPLVAIGRLAHPVNMGASDNRPTRYVFLLLSPANDAELHLEILLSVAQLMADDDFHTAFNWAERADEIREAIDGFEARTATAVADPSPASSDDGLTFSGRFAGGLVADIKRRAPHYLSDFRDGLHPKALAATIFLFFACIAPTVAFGGLMSTLTNGDIGVMEMLISTAIGGVLYAVFSGQPLTIIGGTGPLLVFVSVLYDASQSFGLPFLPTFAWVGLWTSLIVLLIALFDMSAFIRYFTRFTDETFAFLISVIFIYEALRNLSLLWRADDIDHHTALSSWVLAAGTFIVATQLRDIRKSSYLRPALREFLADFGSVIAIGSMVAAATLLPYADLPTLEIPDTVATTTGRPWLVDLWAMPTWGIFAAIVPAAFCSVLIYLDQHITARLVNRSENRLKKGPGYHLDLTVTALLMAVNSLFGIPWLVAATVRSLNHILALATVEESVDRSGAVRENIVHVRENRLSGIAIHLLLGLSVFILPQLKRVGIEIPMSVILGLFLFMGVTSLTGNQFWDRLKLWAMEPSQYPSTHYVRQVAIRKVHLYTAIQLVCFAALWAVRASAAAIVFPMMIAVLVPVRLLLGRFFTERELASLDSEEAPDEELLREAGV